MFLQYIRILLCSLSLLGLCSSTGFATTDSTQKTDTEYLHSLLPTAVHVGIGSQKLTHLGFRQEFSYLSFQLDVGIGPVFYKGSSYTIGLDYMNKELLYGLEFSQVTVSGNNTDQPKRMILSGNVGWLFKPSKQTELIVKSGLGVVFKEGYPFTFSRMWNILLLNLECEVGFRP